MNDSSQNMESEVEVIDFPEYTSSEMFTRIKIKHGIIPKEKDWKIITSDLKEHFEIGKLTELTDKLRNYIRSKYFDEFNESWFIKKVNQYL